MARDNRFRSIYKKLYAFFGPQHWWPAESPFEVMVGAILTQNTAWANVEKAIANLKRNNLLKARKLYELPAARLSALIRPAGYYNVKTKRLREYLRFFLENYGADCEKMSQGSLKALRQQLLGVYGIGPETADSILLYALNKPSFVVDAYTKRIFSRHKLILRRLPNKTKGSRSVSTLSPSASLGMVQRVVSLSNHKPRAKARGASNGLIVPSDGYEQVRDLFMKNLTASSKLFNEYHALIVKLAKVFCLKNKPRCSLCPLK